MSRIILKYTENDLKDLDIPNKILLSGKDYGDMEITLNNGDKVIKNTRQAVMLIIGLRPYFKLGIPVTAKHFDFNYTGEQSKKFKFDVWSNYYDELINIDGIDHHTVYGIFAESVNYLSNLIVRYMGKYQQSMSILSLARIQCNKDVAAICSTPIVATPGDTKMVELEIGIRTKKLINLLTEKGSIPNNVLLPFMWAGALKKNQIPQQMIAYGTRSDIDDTMMKHIIQSSAISGLQNVTEYGIEGLSVKKSEHYKKSVIRDSQYSARGTRLNCAILPHRYKGSCGSNLLLPYVIPEKSADNYVDKLCYLDGELIHINKSTLPKVIGKTIQLISPLGCRHTDGVCERCAGRATSQPWSYIPDVHLGIYAATKVGEAVSQMVLSAKHLIKTNSIGYELIDEANEFFEQEGTNINIKKSICESVKDWFVKIPVKFLGHISGKDQNLKFEESFDEIDFITWVMGDDEVTVNLVNERMSPYFSGKFLSYVRSKRDQIIVTSDDEYIIPMDKFNTRWPIMRFNVINDDMVSYTKACDNFIKNRVSSYTTATSALHDFASVIYSKSSINIFYLEILLRTMLRQPGDRPGLPIIDDYDSVRFDGICRNITTHTLSQKLSYERISATPKSDGLLSTPEVSLTERLGGLYDILLFGH